MMRRSLLPFGLVLGCGYLVAACAPFDTHGPSEMQPEEDVYVADHAPPPISGGTMLVAKDGTVVAADPDRDRVFVVDLAKQSVADIALQQDDEPGRLVEDAAGRIHVALRRGGAIVTIDPHSRQILARRPVCGAPRGIAYDGRTDVLHVACATGELVTMPAVGDQILRSLRLGADLRDVFIEGDSLRVSQFRSAQLITVDANGMPETGPAPKPQNFTETTLNSTYEAAVAWRTLPFQMPNQTGGAIMVHQRGLVTAIPLATGASYYASAGCDGSIVHAAVSFFNAIGSGVPGAAAAIPTTALPVDIAVSPDRARIAVAAAGSSTVVLASTSELMALQGANDCSGDAVQSIPVTGQPTSVALRDDHSVVVQTREPATITMLGPDGQLAGTIALTTDSVRDTGHEVFHTPPSRLSGITSGIACASCHPEGRDDGRVWNFDPIGQRRTQAISGGILPTAPFHWDGDLADMGALMNVVFTTRMGGPTVGPHRVRAFRLWLNVQPLLPAAAVLDAAAVARGKTLFEDPNVGCTRCHSGERFTNNTNQDVGTGKAFQVPSLLGVGARAPYMHNGCAATLAERFDPTCGGGDSHGRTSQLSETQKADLVSYLESL